MPTQHLSAQSFEAAEKPANIALISWVWLECPHWVVLDQCDFSCGHHWPMRREAGLPMRRLSVDGLSSIPQPSDLGNYQQSNIFPSRSWEICWTIIDEFLLNTLKSWVNMTTAGTVSLFNSASLSFSFSLMAVNNKYLTLQHNQINLARYMVFCNFSFTEISWRHNRKSQNWRRAPFVALPMTRTLILLLSWILFWRDSHNISRICLTKSCTDQSLLKRIIFKFISFSIALLTMYIS